MSDNKFEEENRVKATIKAFKLGLQERETKIKELEVLISTMEEGVNSNEEIKQAEKLLVELEEVTTQAGYFSDATQLESIGVKGAANLAAEFKVLGRTSQSKKKQLEAKLLKWQQTHLESKDGESTEVDKLKKEVLELKEEIAKEEAELKKALIESAEDPEHVKALLEGKEIDKNTRATIFLHVITDDGNTTKVATHFIVTEKNGKLHVGKSQIGAFNKGLIKEVKMDLSSGEFTTGGNLDLKWQVILASRDISISNSKGKQETWGIEGGKTITGKVENATELEGELGPKSLLGGAGVKNTTTIGVEDSISVSGKYENTTSNEITQGATLRLDNITLEGNMTYSIKGEGNGCYKITPKGKQMEKVGNNGVRIDSSAFVNALSS